MDENEGIFQDFLTASTDCVARAIASIERDAQRDADLRSAEHRVALAEWNLKIVELDKRLASVAEVENRFTERLAELNVVAREVANEVATAVLATWERPADGISVTVDDLINDETFMERVRPVDGKDGADGTSVRLDDLIPAMVSLLEARVTELTGVQEPFTKGAPQLIDIAVLRVIQAMPPLERGEDGKDGRDGVDGQSVNREEIVAELREDIRSAVAEIPAALDGKDGRDGTDGRDGADGRDGVDGVHGRDGRDGNDGKDGRDGEDGAPGTLPLVRQWTDEEISYRGAVVAHDGETYQALRDTAKEPPHADWICLARAGSMGEPGKDGRSPVPRGAYKPDEVYAALDIVTFNGAAFMARQDNPGRLGDPTDKSWQLISKQGERGRTGHPGPAGLGIERMVADKDQATITITEKDGREIVCDLYDLLSRLR